MRDRRNLKAKETEKGKTRRGEPTKWTLYKWSNLHMLLIFSHFVHPLLFFSLIGPVFFEILIFSPNVHETVPHVMIYGVELSN